jgi:hypothetical protein
MLFGAGWGLVRLCPGPAIENLATLSPQVGLFVLAKMLGMVLEMARETRMHRAPHGRSHGGHRRIDGKEWGR